MKAIVRKRQQRKILEKEKGDFEVEVRGNIVVPQKIDRYMQDHGISQSSLYPASPDAARTIPNFLIEDVY